MRGVTLSLSWDHTTGRMTKNSNSRIICSWLGARHKGCLSSLNFLPSPLPRTGPPVPLPPRMGRAPRDFQLLISATQRNLATQVWARSHPSPRYFCHVCGYASKHRGYNAVTDDCDTRRHFWSIIMQSFRSDTYHEIKKRLIHFNLSYLVKTFPRHVLTLIWFARTVRENFVTVVINCYGFVPPTPDCCKSELNKCCFVKKFIKIQIF
jgi:hypothetical protein